MLFKGGDFVECIALVLGIFGGLLHDAPDVILDHALGGPDSWKCIVLPILDYHFLRFEDGCEDFITDRALSRSGRQNAHDIQVSAGAHPLPCVDFNSSPHADGYRRQSGRGDDLNREAFHLADLGDVAPQDVRQGRHWKNLPAVRVELLRMFKGSFLLQRALGGVRTVRFSLRSVGCWIRIRFVWMC